MASQYSLWMEDYKKLTESVKGVPLVDIKEVLSVEGKHFILALGKENFVKNGDQEIDMKYMRAYYTGNKDVFANVLETIKARATEQRAFAINICNALTEQAVPEVVMARMKGEEVSGDAFDMMKLGTKKTMEKLGSVLWGIHNSPFESFDITIPSGGKHLRLKEDGVNSTIFWGDPSADDSETSMISGAFSGARLGEFTEGSLENEMFFLTNIGFIETDLKTLGIKLANVLTQPFPIVR